MGLQSIFNRYLLPGFVFQGVVIGGGYATGRELVEFFLPHGPIGGLLAMLVSAIVWSLVIAIYFKEKPERAEQLGKKGFIVVASG